ADAPGFADAVLGVLTIPAWLVERRHQQEERARAEAARRVEEERQRKLRQDQQTEQRRAEARQARERAVSRRREKDRSTLVTAFVLCVTVLVPWLLGHFLMQDRLFRPPNPRVFLADARDTGTYFLTDWTAGCAAILLAAALFVVLRPWWRRPASLVFAGIFAAVAIVGLAPYSIREWTNQENRTAATLRSTVFPFDNEFYTCGQATAAYGKSKVLAGESDVVYTLFSARTEGSTVDGCNMLVFYQGWRMVKSVTLKKGQIIKPLMTSSPLSVSRKQKIRDAVFTVRLASGKTVKYRASNLLR
ncbi:MAG TPA: hypothetical protein VF635_00455, partial [Propionibacteriaceae bacterium]